MGCRIIGCGSYLPDSVLTNKQLEQMMDTSDEWIISRTGIKQRHVAHSDELVSQMAYQASVLAIHDAGIDKSEIDLVIVCTTTPDNTFPATSTKLQGYLSLGAVPSFDLQAVCSGFVYGLHVANALMQSSGYKTVLLVCVEKMSSIVDWEDRGTAVLFGDGAGAVILQNGLDNRGLIASNIYSDGSYYDILNTDGGVSINGQSGKIRMKGQELFKHAVEKLSSSIRCILDDNKIYIDEIDCFIPHQANIRIIDNVISRLGVDDRKVVKTIDKHANCSAASIPLALFTAKPKLKANDLVLFAAFGAGLTWGAAVMRW